MKIYPDVTASQLAQAIRHFLSQHKIHDLAQGLQDLLSLETSWAPRLSIMIKYADMVVEVVKHAKNGVLSHCTLKRALEDVCVLVPGVRQPKTIVLELSAGIRILMAWFREFGKGWFGIEKKKGSVFEKLSKVASPAQKRFWQG